jgi:NADH:ubiquinone oxidoreductase subunit K
MKIWPKTPLFSLLVLFFIAAITIEDILHRQNWITILSGIGLILIYNYIFIVTMDQKSDEIKNKKSSK